MSLRNLGLNSLRTVLKIENNVKLIEELIYKSCKTKYKVEDEELQDKYKETLYQIIDDISNKKMNIKIIAKNIKDYKIGLDHHSYDEMRLRLKEQDDYIIKPFEVEEGVMECNKCGNKRVITYSKQTRGGDEATSVFCTCTNPKCGNRWKV